jgi:hypothetical protein
MRRGIEDGGKELRNTMPNLPSTSSHTMREIVEAMDVEWGLQQKHPPLLFAISSIYP